MTGSSVLKTLECIYTRSTTTKSVLGLQIHKAREPPGFFWWEVRG
jgi:hypothetical protein